MIRASSSRKLMGEVALRRPHSGSRENRGRDRSGKCGSTPEAARHRIGGDVSAAGSTSIVDQVGIRERGLSPPGRLGAQNVARPDDHSPLVLKLDDQLLSQDFLGDHLTPALWRDHPRAHCRQSSARGPCTCRIHIADSI